MPQFDVNSPSNVSPDPPVTRNKRRALLGLYEAGKFPYKFIVLKQLDGLLSILEYGLAVWSRKPKVPVDVDAMVQRWREAVVGMTLAPDKKTVDEWEHKLNDLLEPFLKAPVKQIREFCKKLVEALDADPQIPFFIKAGVSAYINVIVKSAKDTDVIELKKDIAGRIAKAVEGDVQPQLVEAITNALMWRDPETLKKVEDAVKKGGKAKFVGKESCLFLEVAGEIVML
jgi:hypothetical protein